MTAGQLDQQRVDLQPRYSVIYPQIAMRDSSPTPLSPDGEKTERKVYMRPMLSFRRQFPLRTMQTSSDLLRASIWAPSLTEDELRRVEYGGITVLDLGELGRYGS